MFTFGDASKKHIAGVHDLLQDLAYETIKRSAVDFGVLVNGGLRTAEEQKALFDQGRSKCDGYKVKSYHQSGLAIDFVPYIAGSYTWSNENAFLAIAATALAVWEEVADKQGYYLHWGGFWSAGDLNQNAVLDPKDRLGWDPPHFELRTAPQKGVYPVVPDGI